MSTARSAAAGHGPDTAYSERSVPEYLHLTSADRSSADLADNTTVLGDAPVSRAGWSSWLAPVLTILAFSTLLYGPWLLIDGFSPRQDVLRQSVPWLSFARQEVLAGRLPSWDPARLAGVPHLANIQAGFFYPPNLPLLLPPPAIAATLSLVAHVILGGVLLTVLARALGLSREPATLAGMAYVAGGFVTARVYASHLEVLRTMAWAPLLLLSAWQLAMHGSPRWAAVLTLTASLSLLAGYPAVTVYSLGAAGLLFLAILPKGRKRIQAVGLGVLSMLLPLLICAPALWPLAELAEQTTRADGLALTEAAVGALRPSDFPTLVWPWYFGTGPLDNYWRGPGWFWHETQTAGGMGVTVLAIVGALSYRRVRQVQILLALALVSLLLSLGTLTPAYTLLHEMLPFLRLFRIPARFNLVWTLMLPLLAGYGLQAVLERRAKALTGVIRLGAGASIVGLAALGVVTTAVINSPLPSDVDAAALLQRVPSASMVGTLSVLLGTLVLLGISVIGREWRHGRTSRSRLTVGLGVTVLLELTLLGLPSIFRSPESLPRLLDMLGAKNIQVLQASPYRVALEEQLKAYANVGDILGFQSVTAYDPLLLGRTTALLRASQGNLPEPFGAGSNYITLQRDGGAAFDVLGVGYRVQNSPGRVTLVKRETPVKHLTLVERAQLVASPQESLAAVLAPGFNPHEELVLEKEPLTLQSQHPSSASAVRVIQERPGLLHARVEAHNGGYLLFSESYYPGWLAEAGGQRAPLVPANHAVMAVGLSPGSHDVVLRFTTPWLVPSLALSIAGLLGWTALLLWPAGRQAGLVSR